MTIHARLAQTIRGLFRRGVSAVRRGRREVRSANRGEGMMGSYDPRLAAQFVGYTLLLAGGPMDKTVMSKLIYMADREYAKRNCAPFLDDIHRALPNGPICQRALDGLNGKRDRAVFERYVQRDGETLTLAAGLREEDFGDLNAAAFAIAEDLFARYGHLSKDEIVAFTHGAEFPEWAEAFAAIADDGAMAADITDEAFARAAGVDPDSYAAIAEAERGAGAVPKPRGAGR